MFCQSCGATAETRWATFYQNVGLLIMRFSTTYEGNFCKSCVHQTFWKTFFINLLFGWWGIISFIVNCFFMINNTVQYIGCLGMAARDPTPRPVSLSEADADRIAPFFDEIFDRLQRGEQLDGISQDVAMRAGVQPGQVAMLVSAVIAQAQQQ